jgi:protein farnesyltransferase/geranylgeranyltransferase type-1 subunit alpha
MNPAHYTVWLYRFKIIAQLGLPIPEEIEWLNQVALSNLKNYQIWHHRQLLMDHYYPSISDDADAVRRLGKSETDFVVRILSHDSKNYHVWSYRQYIVGKLGLWTPAELGAAQNMIEDDVRNNSAWSHRFYVIFSNPKQSTPESPPTAHDPAVPSEVIDREIAYTKEKIVIAPQNQSSWNYLRGVLAKGGRGLTSLDGFAEQFVDNLGEGDEKEIVKSSHALDWLADAYKEQGDKDRAKLCLQRLSDKWDPVRAGYWKFRMSEIDKAT